MKFHHCEGASQQAPECQQSKVCNQAHETLHNAGIDAAQITPACMSADHDEGSCFHVQCGTAQHDCMHQGQVLLLQA